MNRRHFLTAGAFALSGAASGQTGSANRPNVIVIMADDLGFGDVSCNGAKDISTPNLDRLAAQGVRFTNWHANSPVCSPSRASLLTGKYPQTAGIPEILFSRPTFDIPGLRQGEHTLASELKKHGYQTAAVGKWHLGSASHSRPLAQGFDEFFGFYSGWTDYYSHRYYTLGGQPVFHDLWRNDKEVWEEPAYQTELLAREAGAFINRQNRNQPFFLYLAFGAPHYPMMAPQRHMDRLPASMDRDRRLHAAVVAALDEAVGQVLATVDKKGLTNTIVFFQSDNGATREARADHQGRPYTGGSNLPWRGAKGSLFEGGTRVPAMMRWTGQLKPKQTLEACCAAMDLMPTVLHWCGAAAPAGIEGFNLADMLTRGAAAPKRTLYFEYLTQRAANDGRWKLVVNAREGLGLPETKGGQLFDLQNDPYEKQDISKDNVEIVARLTNELAKWSERR